MPRLEAVIPRPPRVSTAGHEPCVFRPRQDRRVACRRSPRGIVDVGALLPCRHRLRVYIVARGQLRSALLTRLERPTHRRGRAGAAVS
jgi:hypothetical protein